MKCTSTIFLLRQSETMGVEHSINSNTFIDPELKAWTTGVECQQDADKILTCNNFDPGDLENLGLTYKQAVKMCGVFNSENDNQGAMHQTQWSWFW